MECCSNWVGLEENQEDGNDGDGGGDVGGDGDGDGDGGLDGGGDGDGDGSNNDSPPSQSHLYPSQNENTTTKQAWDNVVIQNLTL